MISHSFYIFDLDRLVRFRVKQVFQNQVGDHLFFCDARPNNDNDVSPFFVYSIAYFLFLPFSFSSLFTTLWATIKDILYCINLTHIFCRLHSRFFAWRAHKSAKYLRSRSYNSILHRKLYISLISFILNSSTLKC